MGLHFANRMYRVLVFINLQCKINSILGFRPGCADTLWRQMISGKVRDIEKDWALPGRRHQSLHVKMNCGDMEVLKGRLSCRWSYSLSMICMHDWILCRNAASTPRAQHWHWHWGKHAKGPGAPCQGGLNCYCGFMILNSLVCMLIWHFWVWWGNHPTTLVLPIMQTMLSKPLQTQESCHLS